MTRNSLLISGEEQLLSLLKIFLYILFALISIGINLGSQWFTTKLYEPLLSQLITAEGIIQKLLPLEFYVSIFIGTGTGLVAKYLLDKFFIFEAKTENATKEGLQFLIYTTTGIVTTGIFWGIEYLFHILWVTENSKYIGGFVGLCIGYVIKYFLDKNYTFKLLKKN